jgi:S1-C subfamily serine protease
MAQQSEIERAEIDPPAVPNHGSMDARDTMDVKDRKGSLGNSRLFRLVFMFFCLALVIAGPFVVGQFQYQTTYSTLKAEVDVSREALRDLKPKLTDFVMVSRLVAKRVSPSVVGITLPGPHGTSGHGSGVIVDPIGYIVTNYHVIAKAEQFRVRLGDGRESDATVVGGDPGTDVAILRIDLKNLIAAEWGDSEDLEVGDLVWAWGSPFGLDHSVTFGIVSAKGRRIGSGVTSTPYQEYLQTDAAVQPGNSGGPLVNIEGKIVGINTAIMGPLYRGVSLAIPSNLVREKYEQLLEKGWIARGYLGVSPRRVPVELREKMGLDVGEGVYVREAPRDGPGYKAGVRPGDVILEWNGSAATDPTLLSRMIAATEVGSSAQMVVARRLAEVDSGDQSVRRLELDVVVGRHPDY